MASLSKNEFSIIVVTYNSAHCISALAEILDNLSNVFIVDNASDDETALEVNRKLPAATLLQNYHNLGFGAANNRALNLVSTPYALLLNPDCLPSADFFEGMLKAAAQFPNAAIIAPHLINRNGDPEVSYRWPATYWKPRGAKTEGPCCVGFVCGAAMLLNMEVMREVGFFDESFFLYYEDEDLCQRVFMQKKQIVVVPNIEIIHLSRGSVKGPSPLKSEFIRGFHHAQSKLVFETKHFGITNAKQLRRNTLLLAILMLLPRLLLPQPKYIARLVGRIAGLLIYKYK